MPQVPLPDYKEGGQTDCLLISGILCMESNVLTARWWASRIPQTFLILLNVKFQAEGQKVATSPICPERNECALKIKYDIIALVRFILIK